VGNPIVPPGGRVYGSTERVSGLTGFREGLMELWEGGLVVLRGGSLVSLRGSGLMEGRLMRSRGEEYRNVIPFMDSGTTSYLLARMADNSAKVEAKSPLVSGDLKAKVSPHLAVSACC